MKEIQAYQVSNGEIFTDEKKAISRQQDIIGEMLDGLIPNDDRGNITRTDRHNVLMKMLNDKELKKKIKELYFALIHDNEYYNEDEAEECCKPEAEKGG